MPTETSGCRFRMSTVSWYHGVGNITDSETGRPVAIIRSSAMFTLWLMPPSSLRITR